MKERQETEIDLLKLAKALWKRAWAIVLAAVIGGVAAFTYTKVAITPLYQAKVMLYVNNSTISFGGSAVSLDLSTAKSLVSTYLIILKTRWTLNDVIEEADLPYSYGQLAGMISAASVNSTEIFEVVVTSPDPNEAEKIANTIGKVLPEKIGDIVDGSSVRIVDYAVVPGGQSSPNVNKNTMMGILLGIVLSCGVIVMIYLFDDTLRAEDDTTELYDLPLLATIPDLVGTKSSKPGYSQTPPYGTKR